MPVPGIRVLIADDQEVVRAGWKMLLDGAENISVVGEAATPQSVPQLVKDLDANALLLDIKWYGDDAPAYAVIRELKSEDPAVIIIAVTVYELLIPKARAAGADAVVMKDIPGAQLISMLRHMVGRKPPPAPPPPEPELEPLTGREAEVLRLVVDGCTDRQIADRLVITHATAKNHVKHILAKLGVHSRTQAIKVARERRLLD